MRITDTQRAYLAELFGSPKSGPLSHFEIVVADTALIMFLMDQKPLWPVALTGVFFTSILIRVTRALLVRRTNRN